MRWRTLATEAIETADPALWADIRFIVPTAISIFAVVITTVFGKRRDSRGQETLERAERLEEIATAQEERASEQDKRANEQHQLAVEQEARNRRQDAIADREVATQLRVARTRIPGGDGRVLWVDGIEITNHHPQFTFTEIDVVLQTDDVPPPHVRHIDFLSPGQSKKVRCPSKENVRVVYRADHAGQWEIRWAGLDPQWNRLPTE